MNLAEVKNRRRTGNKTDGFIVKADDLSWLIAEVERLTALCDGYRGEVATVKGELDKACRGLLSAAESHQNQFAVCQELMQENMQLRHALTRARAEGMEWAGGLVASVRDTIAGAFDGGRVAKVDDILSALDRITAAIRAKATE